MRSESVECVMFVPDTPENRSAFMGKELLLAEIYKLSNIKIVFKDISRSEPVDKKSCQSTRQAKIVEAGSSPVKVVATSTAPRI